MIKTYSIPSSFMAMFLHEEYTTKQNEDLQWYFNDLYKFFLYSITSMAHSAESISDEQHKKMVAMLTELISVKNMLAEKQID